MEILGITSDDRGAQLEALVRFVLERQGYVRAQLNYIAAGGNELDLKAELDVSVMSEVRVTPVICEAKAYSRPVAMPDWLKFLGKLMIARLRNASTMGVLVALNGVNGNVAGSLEDLRLVDQGVFVITGGQLLALAVETGSVADEATIGERMSLEFGGAPIALDPLYYGGAYYWAVRWVEDRYLVVDGLGNMLPAESIESLRAALENTLPGEPLPASEAQALSEGRHAEKIRLLARLFAGEMIDIDNGDPDDVLHEISREIYCRVTDNRVALIPPTDMSAEAISRLFTSMFAQKIRVRDLRFVAEGRHVPYVERLVEQLTEVQDGFTLDPADAAQLRAIAPNFLSVWAFLAVRNPMLANQALAEGDEHYEPALASTRGYFWGQIMQMIKTDFANPFLSGFLYDYLGVAELEEVEQLTIKTKTGPLPTIQSDTRNGVRQLSDELVGEATTRHARILMLPNVNQPWEDEHPDPVIELYPLDAVSEGDAAQQDLGSGTR